jgi:hypothetical protein
MRTTTTTPDPTYRRIHARTLDGTHATVDLEGIAQDFVVSLRNDAGPTNALDFNVEGQAQQDGVFEVFFNEGAASKWYDIEVHAGMTGEEIEHALLQQVQASPVIDDIAWVQLAPTFMEIPYATHYRDEGQAVSGAVRVSLDVSSVPL